MKIELTYRNKIWVYVNILKNCVTTVNDVVQMEEKLCQIILVVKC